MWEERREWLGTSSFPFTAQRWNPVKQRCPPLSSQRNRHTLNWSRNYKQRDFPCLADGMFPAEFLPSLHVGPSASTGSQGMGLFWRKPPLILKRDCEDLPFGSRSSGAKKGLWHAISASYHKQIREKDVSEDNIKNTWQATETTFQLGKKRKQHSLAFIV